MELWKIGILVDDLEAAEKFYTQVLNMKFVQGGTVSVFLDAGAVNIELIDKKVFEGDARLGKPGIHHLSFKVDDINIEAKELKEKGATFIKEPYERLEGLYLGIFDGLNGVNLQLFDDRR